MKLTARRSVLTATLCLGLCGAAGAVPPAGRPACVLLQNGNVMTGHVTRTGGRVLLSRDGSEIWLEDSMVAHVAATHEEVYHWKRDQNRRPTVEDHLRLADWCISQRLVPQASRELLEARVADPRDRRIEALQQRLLRLAKGPQVDHSVVPAAYEAPAPASGPDAHRQESAMTAEELQRLPDGVVEQFTRRIQPILVNNCTSGGCHQGLGPESYQLDRSLLHGAGDYRSTQANLAATLRHIDRVDPAKSELLLAAQQPHAGRSTPAFTGRHAALEAHLVAWVNAVCQPTERATTEQSRSRQGGGVFGLVKAKHERDRFIESAEQKKTPPGARDEFDPELFNRRYGPNASGAGDR